MGAAERERAPRRVWDWERAARFVSCATGRVVAEVVAEVAVVEEVAVVAVVAAATREDT